MGDAAQEIKAKLPVEMVLKKYLELRPAGKNFKANCPFHQEKTPSFMVSPERGSWYCFGCNKGGDIFTFVEQYENVEFFEALKILAEQAGVELRRISPEQQRQFGVLYDINEAAKDFYKNRLKESPAAVEYLKSRGVTGETAAEFELGVAPGEWDSLLVYLTGKKFTVADMERAGLIIRSDKRGTYFDRFRNRIMFPIMNHSGKAVAFSGRVLPGSDEEERSGKYVNSPETPIFSKSKILYGFDKSKGEIRERGEALLVEGQMDMVMAWQEGVRNTVAVSGTALSEEHLTALSRVARRLVFNFDADEAGRLAAERAIDMALRNDFEIKVLALSETKDVAELSAARPGALREALRETMSGMEFYLNRYLLPGGDINQKKRGIRTVLAKIDNMTSAVEREYWIRELSCRSGASEEAIREEQAQMKAASSAAGGTGEEKPQQEKAVGVEESGLVEGRRGMLAQRIISLAISEGRKEELERWEKYMTPEWRLVAGVVRTGEDGEIETTVKKRLNLAHLRGGLWEGEKMEDLTKQLKIEWLKTEKQNIMEKIKRLEQGQGAEAEMSETMARLVEISKELDEAVA